MFSKNHGIVAGEFDVEDRVAEVGVGESAGFMELLLDSPEITVGAGIFVGTRDCAEKIVGDVFDCIEAKSVGFGAVDHPANVANEEGSDILFVEVGVGGEDGGGDPVGWTEADIGSVGQFVVVLGVIGVADKGVFGSDTSLGEAEVGVGSFLGDIDEVGEAEVLHLPGGVPVAGIIPFAVEAVFGFFEVKILGNHPWVDANGGGFVVAWDIEGAVIHDVVEVDADAEAVGDFNHLEEFRFGAIAGADGIALIF